MFPVRTNLTRIVLAALVLILGPTRAVVGQTATTSPRRPGMAGAFEDVTDYLALYESGWRLMAKGRFDSAEREFTAALQIARRPGMNDARLLARTYSSLAWALQQQGKVDAAEPLARWALETREARFGREGEPVARSLNQMAMIYLSTNRFNAAEPLLRRVIAMDPGTSEVIEQEQAQSESLLGLGMVAQRRYAEGEIAFRQAVAIRQESQGPRHPELGDELNNLAWAQIEQGEARQSSLDDGPGAQDPSPESRRERPDRRASNRWAGPDRYR